MRWIALAGLIALAGCGGSGTAASSAPARHFIQADDRSKAVRHEDGRYLAAQVRERTWLRDRPDGRVLHRLRPRTEFGSPLIVSVVGRRDGWLKVISSELPNDRRGWIPEDNTTVHGLDVDIVVDRSERRATVRRDGRAIASFRVGVGRPGNETPLGRFAVTDKLHPTDASSPYGCCALALSGRQTRLEPGWRGGDRLAIHGTQQPETIGRAASLGCMRAPAKALKRLLRIVPLGAPVIVRA